MTIRQQTSRISGLERDIASTPNHKERVSGQYELGFRQSSLFTIKVEKQHLLSTGTAISPYIPIAGESLGLAQGANLRTCNALVVAVVPFTDILGDLNAGLAVEPCRTGLFTPLIPGQRVFNSEVEELEGSLCSLSWGYVSVSRVGGSDQYVTASH